MTPYDIVKRCVDELTNPKEPILDYGSFDYFSIKYINFGIAPDDLLKIIFNRIQENKSNDSLGLILDRIGLLLSRWIITCFYRDFYQKPECNGTKLYDTLLLRLGELSSTSNMFANKIKLTIIRVNPSSTQSDYTKTKRKKKRRRKTRTGSVVADFSKGELVSHITYSEARLFRRIQLKEFINLAWQKRDKKKKAPYIYELVSRFNSYSYSISWEICSCQDEKQRGALISHYIALANVCYEQSNFNALMAILSGLNSNAVDRLKKSWKLVDDKLVETFTQLNDIMTQKNGFSNYREALDKAKGVVLPFLGVFLRDITLIEEGNNDFHADDTINVDKIKLYGGIFTKIQYLQSKINEQYNCFVSDNVIEEYFSGFIKTPPEADGEAAETLYNMSIALEPPASASPS